MTRDVIGAAIEVHRTFGPGLLESVYQACLEHELRLRKLQFIPQKQLPLIYKGVELDAELRMDFYFPKNRRGNQSGRSASSCSRSTTLDLPQIEQTHVGLLTNFYVPVLKDGVKRMVH